MYPQNKMLSRAKPTFVPRWQNNAEHYVVRTCADYPELTAAALQLEADVWESLGYLDYSGAHAAYYDDLLEEFPDFHLVLVEAKTNTVVATANCVPLYVDMSCELPQEGWDWIVESAANQRGFGANMVGGLAVSVRPENSAKGLARLMINAMGHVAKSHGFVGVIVPVRPSLKAAHPEVNIDEYVSWKDDRGRMFDPWLRSHVSAGARLGSVCHRSMQVNQPMDFWSPWIRSAANIDGQHIIDGALVPLKIDEATNTGSYVEPNVWVTYGF
jgi:GNAT superfamily N-acetyltransferase